MTAPKQLQRKGIRLTDKAATILRDLSYDEWKPQPNADRRSLKALWKRDFIDRFPVKDGYLYKLSYRGRELVDEINRPSYRHDGLCPRCGERPVAYSVNGLCKGYCLECLRNKPRKYKKFKYRDQTPCVCGNKRHISPSGRVCSHCLECIRKRQRQQRTNRLERMKNGHVPMCIHCGEHPRHFTEHSAYTLCLSCLKARRIVYHRRNKAKKFAKVLGVSK